jgi:hypothetical protein
VSFILELGVLFVRATIEMAIYALILDWLAVAPFLVGKGPICDFCGTN